MERESLVKERKGRKKGLTDMERKSGEGNGRVMKR
jgi:hypothetical protein